MEDFKFIFYILLAVAYFLFTNWRKFMKGIDEEPKKFRDPDASPEQPYAEPRQHPQRQNTPPPTSFEDILRELQPKAERAQQQAKTTVETVKAEIPVPVEKPKYRNYEAEYASRAQSYSDERLAEARESSRRSQEVRRKQAFEPYAKPKEKQKERVAVELLRNPTTAREAFILSEILQRRY